MGTVSPTQISDGTTIDASDVNNPINTLANEINGNLDENNIADGAIATAKIADGAVTNAKLNTTAGELGGAWQSFTPTINNGSLGDGTLSCEYIQIGKTVIARYNLTFGSSTSITNTGFSIDLPVAADAGFTEYLYSGAILDTGSSTIPATVRLNTTTSINWAYHDWTGSAMRLLNIGSATPITWASGDELNAIVVYEAA